MDSKKELNKLRLKGIFTQYLTFEDYVSQLCDRYAKIYGEILNKKDYELIVKKLIEKEIISQEDLAQ